MASTYEEYLWRVSIERSFNVEQEPLLDVGHTSITAEEQPSQTPPHDFRQFPKTTCELPGRCSVQSSKEAALTPWWQSTQRWGLLRSSSVAELRGEVGGREQEARGGGREAAGGRPGQTG
eukprot:6203845-Pleurochrysis_carterae.AAC.2